MKILFALIFVTTSLIYSLDTENFKEKFINYINLDYHNAEGSSFYNSSGSLKISSARDTLINPISDSLVSDYETEIQSLFTRSFHVFDLDFQFFPINNLAFSGSLGLRIDNLTQKDIWQEPLGTQSGVITFDAERIIPEKSQTLLVPANFNLEYYFTKEKFLSSVNAGLSVPFGDANPLVDSSLNGNGIGFYNIGATLAYRNDLVYFEIDGDYLSRFSLFEDQLRIGLGLDFTKVKNVDLFVRFNYYMNLNEVEGAFTPEIPMLNNRLLQFNGGFAVNVNDFRFKLNFIQTLDGANQLDFRGFGFSALYKLPSFFRQTP